MLNRNKALTNYISGCVASVLVIVLFITLAWTDSSWVGKTSGTDSVALAAKTFSIALLVIFVTYAITTLIFADSKTARKSPLALILSTLMMSLIVAFGTGIIDYTYNQLASSIVWQIILLIVFSISFLLLIAVVQEFNTKFTMAAISQNRADEWEYTNFLQLSLNRISVEHKNNHTILKCKSKVTKVTFVSEEVIERKLILSGDTKSQIVFDIEQSLVGEEKGAIVYLSNTLPTVEGVNDRVAVIKQNDLFKIVKVDKKEKNKNGK